MINWFIRQRPDPYLPETIKHETLVQVIQYPIDLQVPLRKELQYYPDQNLVSKIWNVPSSQQLAIV